jgi:hypothetical protein
VGKKGNCWPELLEFLSPWGSRPDREARKLAMNSPVMHKRIHRIVAVLLFRFRSHQGEREKNEYLYDGKNTGELPKSKQIKL